MTEGDLEAYSVPWLRIELGTSQIQVGSAVAKVSLFVATPEFEL
jgi:hypothetical protein